MHKLTVVVSLVLSLAVARDAAANSDLEASLRAEADAIGALVVSIDATLTAAKRGGISEQAAASHRAAKQQYQEADKLCRARKYEACYGKLRQAKHAVMPAATEVLATGASADVRVAVAKDLDAAARRIAGVAKLLAASAPAEAKAAYQQAEALYREGKTLFEAGKHREAFAKLEPALDQLDVAIRSVWANRSTTRRGRK